MNRLGSFLALACLWLASSATAADRAKVVSVHDGDTITALVDGNRQVKVRLTGIDAPELGQPFGRVARDHLAELVMRKDVELVGDKRDKYGRQLSRVVVAGDDAATSMVAAGLAWHYTRYDHDPRLDAAEREARKAGRGLWKDPAPVPPWEWRGHERERKAAPAR